VWPRPKADKFIESLLLGLPVPGIFLVKEATGRLLVLDGHQRLFTLHAFYTGVINAEEYRLSSVQERFVGKRYKDLEVEDRRRLDDSIIHATVVRQDEPSEDQSSIYVIFERLNTGGVNLQPQEIRVALYHGELVRVLQKLNENTAWRALYGRKSRRLKDMELVLRFLAFHYYADSYRSPMKDFLNRYMASNRNLQRQNEALLTKVFEDTAKTIHDSIAVKAFRPRRAINAAVVDSVMAGVAKRLDKGPIKDTDALKRAYDQLLARQEYTSAVETGTSQEANVRTRLTLAEEAFAKVK
jgi:DnaJ-domain-containing protein 1